MMLQEVDFTDEMALERGGAALQELKEAAETEDEDNRLEYRRKHGDKVLYGQTVSRNEMFFAEV